MGQNDGMPPVRPEAEDNPFRFQGSQYDDSLLTKGPPADIPVPQNVSFQYQAPTQSEAEAARGVARAEPSGGESLIKPTSIEQGRLVPEGAGAGNQEARDQLAQALRGGRPTPTQASEPPPVAEPEPIAPAVPKSTLPDRFGTFQDRGGGLAPTEPPRNIPGGPEAFGGRDYQMPENPLVGRDQQALNQPETSNEIATRSGISEQTNISDALANESRNAANQLADKTASLTSDVETASKGIFEKASSALSEVTGSDVLSGIGSFLGVAGDILGPIMGGVGLYESIKGIAESQSEANQDPYASVRKLIAQGQTKMQGMDAEISADQFAEKIGGTRAPAFGSLAAPVFTTQGLSGMSQHF